MFKYEALTCLVHKLEVGTACNSMREAREVVEMPKNRQILNFVFAFKIITLTDNHENFC